MLQAYDCLGILTLYRTVLPYGRPNEQTFYSVLQPSFNLISNYIFYMCMILDLVVGGGV